MNAKVSMLNSPGYPMPKLPLSMLSKNVVSLLKALGAKGCILVGDPKYYERFGFKNLPDLVLDGVPQEYFLALPFEKNRTNGVVVFHQGFASIG